ncbi:protein suex-1-like [Cydia fagiglandana]|uniref:protein suex-1-like n=1 Tax=Cydia fagiglandana TaxID=1458189 RepID=UPI002FEE5427
MNSILCFALAICASMALTSAYPVAEPAEDISYISLQETAPIQAAADEETLQPEQSRYKRHGWGGGWGHRGYGHGGWGRGWGYGGGWGRRGGWGYGGYGGGYGGGWGGGWYG